MLGGMVMRVINEKKYEAVFTFIKDTKEGKYVEINPNIIDIPRNLNTRDEFLVEEEIPVLFSITNQL